MAQNQNTQVVAQTATQAAASKSAIINIMKNGIKIDGHTVAELLDMSKDEVMAIGQKLEAQIAESNGSTSYFGPRKASAELTDGLEVVKSIYNDMLADEEAFKAEERKARKLEMLKQRQAALEAETFNSMTLAEVNAKIAELEA